MATPPCCHLPPTGQSALFLGVQLAATGLYLGSSFAASHIGMPVLAHDTRIDFFRRQVLTSRNIAGGRVASFAMGGLNYQIEHHLFPNMPRPNLRKARPIVQRFCQDSSITYKPGHHPARLGHRRRLPQHGRPRRPRPLPVPHGHRAPAALTAGALGRVAPTKAVTDLEGSCSLVPCAVENLVPGCTTPPQLLEAFTDAVALAQPEGLIPFVCAGSSISELVSGLPRGR